MEGARRDRWRLVRVPLGAVDTPRNRNLIPGWEDLREREEAVGVRPGQWFLVEDGELPDTSLLAFFRGRVMSVKAAETQRSYARDLKVHLEFLSARGTTWRLATAEDIEDYEFWRRRAEQNPRRVGGSKFNREMAALRLFYEFEAAWGAIAASPITLRVSRRRDGSPSQAAAVRSRDVRGYRVNWLTPRAYRTWRDVGLAGYGAGGLRDDGWRGRSETRNIAFAELLWTSGLRVREAGTLLTDELPGLDPARPYPMGRVADAVAKGAGREFWVSASAIARIETYRRTTRRASVARARSLGRYDDLPGIRRVVRLDRRANRRYVEYVDSDGSAGRASLDELDEHERTLLFADGPEGLEPLFLWLSESGVPMAHESWEAVFTRATDRCRLAGLRDLVCRPHMLRHSFALRMLVALRHRFDRRLGLTPRERQEYASLYGDVFILVKTLLGHRQVETTREIYLAPLARFEVDDLLNEHDDDETFVSAVLARLASIDSRVLDLPEDLG